MRSRPYYLIYIAVCLALIWFDRFTKNLVMAHMNIGDAIPSQDSFVAIRYTINTGVSFSMLEGHTEVLLVIQSVLIVVMAAAFVITYIKLRKPVLQTGICWIIAGGAGNLIDRAAYGHVIDFISVGTFPVWNFADMCVVGGCILLGIYLLFFYRKHPADTDTALPDGPEGEGVSDEPVETPADEPEETLCGELDEVLPDELGEASVDGSEDISVSEDASVSDDE